MTSSAGACGLDVDGRRASDRDELHSTSIPCGGGGVVRHATSGSGPAAHGMTGSSDTAAGPSTFSWREQCDDDDDERMMECEEDRHGWMSGDGHPRAATASGDDVTRSQDNDERGTETGSRHQNSPGFGVCEHSASSSTAVSGSRMHLRSKTSR